MRISKKGNVDNAQEVEILPSPIIIHEDEELIDVDPDENDRIDTDLVDDIKQALLNLQNKIVAECRNAQGDMDNVGGNTHINATFIWSNSAAHKMARLAPKTKEDLKKVPGLSIQQIKRYGERIIATINDALSIHLCKHIENQAKKRKSNCSFERLQKKSCST